MIFGDAISVRLYLANSYNKNGQIEKLDQSEDTRDAHYRRGLLIAPRNRWDDARGKLFAHPPRLEIRHRLLA
jgi:hypothetical protein